MNGNELWKINDILNVKRPTGNVDIQNENGVLKVHSSVGLVFKINVETRKIINNEFLRWYNYKTFITLIGLDQKFNISGNFPKSFSEGMSAEVMEVSLIMNENFDCTQFVSFNYSENPINQNTILSFKKQGFTLIEKQFMRKAKIEFFIDYIENQFYELKNDNFIGEFEDWVVKDNPPHAITKFIQMIKEWMDQINISHFKIFLTSYNSGALTTMNTIS